MAYEAHDWACGEVITDNKLNRIEQGIENASGNVFGIVGSGTCHEQLYYEFDISYAGVMRLVTNGSIAWNHQMDGGYALIVHCKPYMDGDIYVVEVTYYSPSSPNLITTTVYSDTEDGNLRSANCWGLQ